MKPKFFNFLLALFSYSVSTAVAAAEYPRFTVTEGPEVVFDYSTQKCDDIDIPDAPMRAFRKNDGTVVAFATHYRNRRFLGDSLRNLARDCHVSYEGKEEADPSAFNDRTWITATWTNDGNSITALGHNEYQANRFPGRCKFKNVAECSFISILLLHSNDGGDTFTRSDEDSHPTPLAAAPLKADAYPGRPSGYFEPSNIILLNGFYYVLIAQKGLTKEKTGRCLFRTPKIDSLGEWTLYDGSNFIRVAGNPYSEKKMHGLCEPVKGIEGFLGSIAKIKDTNLFAAFTIDSLPTPEGGAVKVAFSKDLINWNGVQTVLKLPPFWSSICQSGHKYSYPAVLDDSSQDRNFGSIELTPYLFLVRSGCNVTIDRDLIRFKLRIDKSP